MLDAAPTPAHRPTHLDYYKQYGLNPVRYDMADRRAHFDRRAALYRTLGVTPLAVRGARVLEVAPGTSQNRLYAASLGYEDWGRQPVHRVRRAGREVGDDQSRSAAARSIGQHRTRPFTV